MRGAPQVGAEQTGNGRGPGKGCLLLQTQDSASLACVLQRGACSQGRANRLSC